MQCPNCQHWNEAGSRFCEECGFELPQNANAAPQVSVTTTGTGRLPNMPSSPPVQPMIPIDEPAPTAFSGPHLTLKSTGSIFKLGNAVVIGREDPALQIDFDGYPDGQYISHRHAQIVYMNDKYYIEDLGSSNGTFVNDRRLAQGQAEPMDEGATIRLGKIELIFHEK